MSSEDHIVSKGTCREERHTAALSTVSAVTPRGYGIPGEANSGSRCVKPRLGECDQKGGARASSAGGHPAQLNESLSHGRSHALKSMSRIRTATGTRLHTGRRREVHYPLRLAPELFVRLSGHAQQTTVGHRGAKKQEMWMNPGTALMPLRGRRRDPFAYPPTVGREVRPPSTPTASTSLPCCSGKCRQAHWAPAGRRPCRPC